MLQYFGFYAVDPLPPAEPEAPLPPEDEVVARASHLADRLRHTQPAPAVGRAWESSTSLRR
jgi:hypothetical protein